MGLWEKIIVKFNVMHAYVCGKLPEVDGHHLSSKFSTFT